MTRIVRIPPSIPKIPSVTRLTAVKRVAMIQRKARFATFSLPLNKMSLLKEKQTHLD